MGDFCKVDPAVTKDIAPCERSSVYLTDSMHALILTITVQSKQVSASASLGVPFTSLGHMTSAHHSVIPLATCAYFRAFQIRNLPKGGSATFLNLTFSFLRIHFYITALINENNARYKVNGAFLIQNLLLFLHFTLSLELKIHKIIQ